MAIDVHALMRIAARAGARGIGRVEPNPAVGCVIVSGDGRILGIGHHHRFGAPHAEIEALAACRAAGHDPRGATLIVTLEPCAHAGKTGPCTEAIIQAGIGRVIYARADPNPIAAGGAKRLRDAGIPSELDDSVREAADLGAPFAKRIASGLPWVIAKWAQTIDGRVASRTGSSKWISNESSRRAVHLVRGRVDAVVTGIGTVLLDDPRLTARGVPIQRTARRIVLDSSIRTSVDSTLIRTIGEAPVTIIALESAVRDHSVRAGALRSAGAEVIGVPAGNDGRVDPVAAMRLLVDRYDATRVMVEAGPQVMGSLFAHALVDEAHVYVAPIVLGDPAGLGPADVNIARELADATRMSLRSVKRLGDDVVLKYLRCTG